MSNRPFFSKTTKDLRELIDGNPFDTVLLTRVLHELTVGAGQRPNSAELREQVAEEIIRRGAGGASAEEASPLALNFQQDCEDSLPVEDIPLQPVVRIEGAPAPDEPAAVHEERQPVTLSVVAREVSVDALPPKTESPPVVDTMIKKVLSVIDYLSSLARVSTTTVRDISTYLNVLWLADIPKEGGHCYSRSWGRDENTADDVWLEVRKLPEPELPVVPKQCKDWVNESGLRNIDEYPELLATISVSTRAPDPQTGQEIETFEKRNLVDYPMVASAWEGYLSQKWQPWSDVYSKYLKTQKVFGSLYSIFQEQQRLGEQYELIIGLGLLTWRQNGGHTVRRHLVAAKASLEFEAPVGRFIVRAAADGDQAEVELDMLESESYPLNADSLVAAGRQLRDNFWDRTTSDSLLTAIANSLESQGRGVYGAEIDTPSEKSASEIPRVEFAPALLLRKRSIKGLLKTLEDMRLQVEQGGKVPEQFLDLCEVQVDSELDETPECETADFDVSGPALAYFPLPANDRQRQIIHKLNAQRGVLVQGPPGTGKSQTIANLICHLLATGQRVLVTSKSARALEVLSDKIPPAIRPLCISMLGSGSEERESLERSVNGILTKVNSRDDISAKGAIDSLEERLHATKMAKAEAENVLIALRERETYIHTVAEGSYQGTAAAIAAQVSAEEEQHGWFIDKIDASDNLPLSDAEIAELSILLVDIDSDTEVELSQYFPDIAGDIPPVERLQDLWRQIEIVGATVSSGGQRLASADGLAISKGTPESVLGLSEPLWKLVAEIESVRRRPMSWIESAIREVLLDLDTPWKELLSLTEDRLGTIKELAAGAQSYAVDIDEGVEPRKLRGDAQVVLAHLKAGGSLKRFGLMPHPVIKKHGETLKQTWVDGQDPFDALALQKLVDFLDVRFGLAEIWSYWLGKEAAPATQNFRLQIAHVEELMEALNHVLSLYDLRTEVLVAVEKIVGLAQPQFADEGSLVGIAQTCQDVLARIELEGLNEELRAEDSKVVAITAHVNAHPLCGELLAAVRERDGDAYCCITDRLQDLGKKAARAKAKQEYLCRLAVKAPRFSADLAASQSEEYIRARLKELKKAWLWRQASAWLTDFDKQDGAYIERNIKRQEVEIMGVIEELAALKAWSYCFSRMKRSHQEHLESWQQAMRRLGKGTGKYANKHRQDAQRHLNKCKEAVPAWVMPLHRVFETVEASPAGFDVVIVDEASQCGYEALPLLYLANKIIVVGDEKQISPEVVGVDLQHVSNLIKTHLGDFEHRASFDIENSLFAHGRIRFGNRICLQEHFRCAPEIIRFSNELCYTSDPLVTLKQCPPNRLDPLKAVHVPSGYREGRGPATINRPEAEALVAQVVECCQRERYVGLTMGIIVLQGAAQAKLIEDLLLKSLGPEEMQQRRILCGNPYSFQGDERDVIFLSMVAARGEGRIGAFVKEKDMRRFNVAASRAKEQMWLFHSVTINDLSQGCMRKRLLTHFLDTSVKEVAGIDVEDLRRTAHAAERWREQTPAPFDSWFEIDVALAIAARGYSVVPQFEFAGKRIDLVVQGGSAQLAVECDGDHWHGRDDFEKDMQRQRMLERCQWVFFRVRESCYRANPIKALEPLWGLLEARGIFPVSETVSESKVCGLTENEIECNGQR